jgi:hypothetical protein
MLEEANPPVLKGRKPSGEIIQLNYKSILKVEMLCRTKWWIYAIIAVGIPVFLLLGYLVATYFL